MAFILIGMVLGLLLKVVKGGEERQRNPRNLRSSHWHSPRHTSDSPVACAILVLLSLWH